jgi:hypothetical protein
MQNEFTTAEAAPRPDRDVAALAALADALVEQVSEARQRYGELRAEIDGVEPPERAPVPETITHGHLDEDIRLYAHRLALTGMDREEARITLHRKFDLDDAGPLVEAVFDAAPPPPAPPLKRRFRRLRRG